MTPGYCRYDPLVESAVCDHIFDFRVCLVRCLAVRVNLEYKSERVSRGTGFLQLDRVIFNRGSSWPCGAQRAVIHPLAASYFPTIPTEARYDPWLLSL